MTLLKLASYLKGKYNNQNYSNTAIAGFLEGLKYCKKITNKQEELMYEYICPELNFKNYTEIDQKLSIIKKKLEKIKL